MRGMFGDPTRHILNGLVLCLFPGTFAVKSLADEKTPARESAADAASASDVIDGYMRAKWREKRLQPAPSADDRVFLLRIYAHLTGRHATMEEVERFVRSRDPDKHRRMIDSLLESEQYARHWAQVWRRALLLNRKPLREADIERFDQWLAGQLHRNQSASLIVRELLTAEGDLRSGGAAAFCYVNGSPQVMAEATGKFFLGLNLRCVACHDRPETKWRRKDFDGIAACFDHVRWVEDGERRAIVSGMRPVPEDRAAAREVAFQSVKVGGEDPREALADWVTSPDNPYFARHVVNRYWKELFARPLEKERQLTRREPGLHEELLSRLAADLVEHRYDLKHLIRTICNSQTYQLGTTDARKTDERRDCFAERTRQRTPHEQMWRKIRLVTGSDSIKPKRRRASLTATFFSRPLSEGTKCERERGFSLYGLSPDFSSPLAKAIGDPKGRLAQVLKSDKSRDEMVERLYQITLVRSPTPEEMKLVGEYLDKQQSLEDAMTDVMHALINTGEFWFIP